MRVETRVNDRIRVRQVRLVGSDGAQLGVKATPEALAMARGQGLDLVEVAPQADPPVCKIMDWGKHKYEQSMRAKESKKRQSQVVIKEMKFRPKIDTHDYETKKKHVVRFLDEGAKVKITIMFRGREMTHTELGKKILDRLAEELDELASVEAVPKLDGRNMIMVLAPTKKAARVPEEPESEHQRGRVRGKSTKRHAMTAARAERHAEEEEEQEQEANPSSESASDDDATGTAAAEPESEAGSPETPPESSPESSLDEPEREASA